MQASQATERWKGDERIVLGIDIGTTFTAVGYAYLYSGGPQVVKRVTEWPGQPAQRHESKVPSIVWYDRYGRPQSFCADARTPAVVRRAEREGWYRAEQFKLHVHPPTMASHHITHIIPLPPNVTIEQIYADILGYLFNHTQIYFEEKEFELAGGRHIWQKLVSQNSIHFVITHPSGWGLQEQTMLRSAALRAGLIPNLPSSADRIYFLSEAEASVHFVMYHADIQSRLIPGIDFAICDAGGSTVDTTLYTVSTVVPSLTLREKRDSACIQGGGIFVDQSAKDAFQKKFYDGNLDPDQVAGYVENAVFKFITEVKPSFENVSGEYPIHVADRNVSNPAIGVDMGCLTLSGFEVEGYFSKWVDQIINSIENQISDHHVQCVLLVGGFGESRYLRWRLRQAPSLRHIQFAVPDQSGAKAASEGAVFWTLKKSVVARATRFAFGVTVLVGCIEQTATQLGRPLTRLHDGTTGVGGGWSAIVPKGHVIEEDAEISRSYERQYETPAISNTKLKDTIYLYDQNQSMFGPHPSWVRGPYNELLPGFQEVCTIEIDLSVMRNALRKVRTKARGCCESDEMYWVLGYRIAFVFGATELKAFLVWKENGIDRRSPASIIPINRAL